MRRRRPPGTGKRSSVGSVREPDSDEPPEGLRYVPVIGGKGPAASPRYGQMRKDQSIIKGIVDNGWDIEIFIRRLGDRGADAGVSAPTVGRAGRRRLTGRRLSRPIGARRDNAAVTLRWIRSDGADA